MSNPILKAEGERVGKIVYLQERTIRREFMRFVKSSITPEALELIGASLTMGNVEAVLRFVDGKVAQLANVLGTVFLDTAQREANAVAERMALKAKRNRHVINVTDPRITEPIARRRQNFTANLTRQQRDLVREALIDGLRRGATTIAIAREFANTIGLTRDQRRAVRNYQTLLETNDPEVLRRELRDPRFDTRVQGAIDENRPLTADQIEMMVGRYTDNIRLFRAQRIAHAEALGIVSEARDAAVRQVAEAAGLNPRKGTKTWLHTTAANPRETHLQLVDTTISVDDYFVSPTGARLLYPGDASLGAGAKDIVNCQCGIHYDFEE